MLGFSELPSEITIFSGLVLGLLTSFHCVGMCGPIALSLPLQGDTKWKKLLGGILYNLGRTVTYALMGLAFGLLGHGLSTLGFQKMVSIIAGTLMIATVFFPAIFKSSDLDSGLFSFVNSVKQGLKGLFSTKSFWGLFLIGLLNGLLPCGFVYFFAITAASTASPLYGAIVMMVFGLSTIPAMFSLGFLATLGSSTSFRNMMMSLSSFAVIVYGAYTLFRAFDYLAK